MYLPTGAPYLDACHALHVQLRHFSHPYRRRYGRPIGSTHGVRVLVVSHDDEVVDAVRSSASTATRFDRLPDARDPSFDAYVGTADMVVVDDRVDPPIGQRRGRSPSGSTVLDAVRRTRPTVAVLWIRQPPSEQHAARFVEVGRSHRGPVDVLFAPWHPLELRVRVQLLGSRLQATEAIDVGPFTIDPKVRAVRYGDRVVALPRREFDLLWLFASNPGRVFERSEILERVWGDDYEGTERTVDVRVAHLRSLLGDARKRSTYIRTVRGVGYRFDG